MKADIILYGVFTTPDKKRDRGMKLAESDVKKYAIKQGIEVFQPEKIKKNEQVLELLRKINPDLICVVAYGKILPKEILKIPKFGCINVHASLLPKYRGAAPIQWAVLNGDKVTGVSTMYMNEKMDEGDIIFQEQTEIGEYETTGELWDRLKEKGADLLVKTVKAIEEGKAPRTKQGPDFSVAPMIEKKIAKIDFEESARKIKNKVYGLNPFMGAYGFLNEKKIKFWKVKIFDDNTAYEVFEDDSFKKIAPGTVILANSKIRFVCKSWKRSYTGY